MKKINNDKLITIQEKQWSDFVNNNQIKQKLSHCHIGESFLVPLNRKGIHNGLSDLDREGIHNGLSDLGRDGTRGGAKLHAAFKQELHPEYKVDKVCNDPNNKRLKTHLKITKLS